MQEEIDKVVRNLVLKHPFWGTIVLSLEFRLVDEIPSRESIACTDGNTVYLAKDFVEKVGIEDLKFVILHEVLHVILFHLDRQQSRDRVVWNVACDYAVNAMIYEIGFRTTLPCLYDPRLSQLTAEEIYDKLIQQLDKVNRFQVRTAKHDSFMTKNEFERSDVFAPYDLEEQISGYRERIEEVLVRAYEVQRSVGRGTLPSGLDRHIKKLIEPKVPFETLLARFVSAILAKSEFTYSPPMRKYALYDIVMPSLYGSESRVIVAVDTSGSMDMEKLEISGGVIKKLSSLTSELTVITCDCKIHQVIKTSEIMHFLKSLNFKGGGGTSHLPVFEFIDNMPDKPDVVICLTDGDTEYPKKKPSYPVVWILMGDQVRPPWGEVIYLKD